MSVVYALVCPHTDVVRYIGLTRLDPKKRLAAHIRDAKAGAKFYSSNWIRSLGDLPPRMMILEECEDVNRAEEIWIAWGKQAGLKLTNLTIGGEGTVLSESAKRRQRIGRIKQEIARGRSRFELQNRGYDADDIAIAARDEWRERIERGEA